MQKSRNHLSNSKRSGSWRELLRIVIVVGFLGASANGAQNPVASETPLVTLPLEEGVLFNVPVPIDGGNTTFVFPAVPAAIRGAKFWVKGQNEDDAKFIMDYKEGAKWFNIRALSPGAVDIVTVVINDRVYQFRVYASNQPWYTVQMYQAAAQSPASATGAGVGSSPAIMAQLVSQSRAYSMLRAQHPELLIGVKHVRLDASPQESGSLLVYLRDVWRYDATDTLVFRVVLFNQGTEPIYYGAQAVRVRVGQRVMPIRYVESDGGGPIDLLPANATRTVWMALSGDGTADMRAGGSAGRRNDLDVQNDWRIELPAETATADLHRDAQNAQASEAPGRISVSDADDNLVRSDGGE